MTMWADICRKACLSSQIEKEVVFSQKTNPDQQTF